jgi:hypothetical protein
LATYPGEYYPVDNLAALGALAVSARLEGDRRSELVERLLLRYRRDYRDRHSGLLIQAVSVGGKARDDARGSGTALGAYFAAYASAEFARELHTALTRHLAREALGFGVVREYTHDFGRGDIDSGPLLFGLSVSATGFSLGSARAAGDGDHYRRVHRTAYLFGAPVTRARSTEFVAGGPLGNALMLAMATAPRPEARP